MMIIKAHPLMEVLGYLATIMLDVLNGAVPGTILRVVAVLRLAASVPPAIVSSISVFELCVRFRGLCNPLPFYSLALFSIFFTLYILAESESILKLQKFTYKNSKSPPKKLIRADRCLKSFIVLVECKILKDMMKKTARSRTSIDQIH
jgi:hypothetical protein